MTAAVGILTAAPWHDSIGDIATAEVTLDHLAAAGIPARHISSADEAEGVVVIGGGALLTPVATDDQARVWTQYRLPGDHILNACGLADGLDDLGFLADYRLVTVRDQPALERVQTVRPDASAVPCPATLVRPYEWDFARVIPGYAHLRHLQPGEYVVVQRHPALAPLSRTIDMPVLVVDAQAWQSYRWRGAGVELPSTHSTRIVQTFITNAAAVITNSLHLAIFALGAGVPLAAIDFGNPQSTKVRRYLGRAGLDDVVVPIRYPHRRWSRRLGSVAGPFARRLGYPDVVQHALDHSALVRAAGEAERSRTVEHLDRVAAACRG